MTPTKWKNVMFAGIILFLMAFAVQIVGNVFLPNNAATIAVQQAKDTTDAHVETRAVNEALATFNFSCDMTRFVGLLMAFGGMMYLMKSLAEKQNKGGDTEPKPSENK